MTTQLHDLLARLRTQPGVDLAAAVAADGLLIESAARPGLDVEAIAAVASNGLAMAEAMGREIDKGGVTQTILEYEHGLVVIAPLTSEVMLLLVTNTRDVLGRVRLLLAAHRDAFAEALHANRSPVA